MILDDFGPNATRYEARSKVDEKLAEPFDTEEAEEYHRDLWNQRNVEAMRSGGIGTHDDPHFMG
jgi:hypothetical protein